MLFDKFVKEFKVREEKYQLELKAFSKIEAELKHLKEKYQNLEDTNDGLENDLATAMA